jgi:hypothetical protein
MHAHWHSPHHLDQPSPHVSPWHCWKLWSFYLLYYTMICAYIILTVLFWDIRLSHTSVLDFVRLRYDLPYKITLYTNYIPSNYLRLDTHIYKVLDFVRLRYDLPYKITLYTNYIPSNYLRLDTHIYKVLDFVRLRYDLPYRITYILYANYIPSNSYLRYFLECNNRLWALIAHLLHKITSASNNNQTNHWDIMSTSQTYPPTVRATLLT